MGTLRNLRPRHAANITCQLLAADRVQRYILHFITFSNVLIVIPELFLLWFQCRPVTALWNPLEQNRCDFPRNNKFAIFQGGKSRFKMSSTPFCLAIDGGSRYLLCLTVWLALSDLVQATIPLFIIWPLQMPRRTKFGLSLLMSLGYFAAGSTIARTYAIKTLSEPDLSRESYMLVSIASPASNRNNSLESRIIPLPLSLIIF